MKKIYSIFIVDDDIDDREIFIEAVKKIDPLIQCSYAIDGYDALEKLKHALPVLPDLIFLDLNMPRVDGKQFLSSIKEDERFSTIPVVIYTTSSSAKDKDDTKKLGADYFLTKPSSLKELISMLTAVIKNNTLQGGR